MMKNPKISVIIPSYNSEKYIGECLKSLQRQSFKDFESIVVDDCSKDETPQIACQYAKVVCNEKNMGEGASRNVGAKLAMGEILVHTDADVVLPNHWLEKIVENMGKFNVKCVGGGYCGSLGDSFMERFAYLELEYRRRGLNGYVNTLVSNNFACERGIFWEMGGFPEKYKGEDLRLSYRISRKYKIFWDRDNGVLHHFRNTLSGYLRQQYYFARDTVLAYFGCPSLIFVKNHQGRTIYIEGILMVGLWIMLFIHPLYALVPFGLILFINSGFLLFVAHHHLSPFKAITVVLCRDVVCLLGVIMGVMLCLMKRKGRK